MAATVEEFSAWLGNKLRALNTDESVFGSYITGILDGDDSVEEKTEAIQEILTEIIESDISVICKEIIDKWQKCHQKDNEASSCSSEDVDTKLVRLLESHSLATTAQREYTAEERKIREAILAQYSQMTDDEDEQTGPGKAECSSSSGTGDSLERNTNAYSVMQAEKEKRDAAKLESQRKKDKDKEDREKQKQMKEDKKEKRKTQKGERRR